MRAQVAALLAAVWVGPAMASAHAQSGTPGAQGGIDRGSAVMAEADGAAALPAAPSPSLAGTGAGRFLPAAQAAGTAAAQVAPAPPPAMLPQPPGSTPITRDEAERLALQRNPRISASHLLALAAGQVTRETQSGELPQITGNMTAEKAEDGSRISAGGLTSSRVYTDAGAGGMLSQLITDFGHTRELVTNSKLLAKAQQQNAVATEQDVLLATDEAFYRLLNAQALLAVAQATVQARQTVQNLTAALTRSALRSTLDLNVAQANLSQAQLLQLDAENAVASAQAALNALLAAPPATTYYAVEGGAGNLTAPPIDADTLTKEAEANRPDLKALQFNAEAEHHLARANELQNLPTISALATGGVTPVRPDGTAYPVNWWGGAAVNLSVPLFTGFRISAETKEAQLRAQADEKQAANLSNDIARDVRVATLNAQTAFQRIGVAENFRRETAQALSLAQTRYKLGLTSIVELSQAQLQSTEAAVEAVNARFDYLMSLRALDYARGQLAP